MGTKYYTIDDDIVRENRKNHITEFKKNEKYAIVGDNGIHIENMDYDLVEYTLEENRRLLLADNIEAVTLIDDLLDLLISKNTIKESDLPEQAKIKYNNRKSLRQ